MQVDSSEWWLGVQIQKFESKFNIEIRDGHYCCCDLDKCYESVSEVHLNAANRCWKECKIYFDIFFQVCYSNELCYIVTQYILDATATQNITIPSEQLKLGKNDQVM